MYEVEVSSGAQRQVRRLPEPMQERIIEAIEGLADNPRPHGVKKLSGMDGYRIRVGDYRILYWVEDSAQRVEVYRVMARSEGYREN